MKIDLAKFDALLRKAARPVKRSKEPPMNKDDEWITEQAYRLYSKYVGLSLAEMDHGPSRESQEGIDSIAAFGREVFERGEAGERERCAKIADAENIDTHSATDGVASRIAERIAAAIRRGE